MKAIPQIAILVAFSLYSHAQTKCDIKEIYRASDLSQVDHDAVVLADGELHEDALILVPTTLDQGVYEIEIKREDSNLYRILDQDLFIMTRYCYEYASYREDALLRWESNYGYTKGQLIFDYD